MFLFHPCRSEHSVLYASGNSIFRNIQRDHSRTWLDDTLYFNEGSAPKISDLSAANLNGMLTSSPSFDVSGGQDVRPLGGYLVIKIDAGTTARGYMWTMPATQDDTAVSAYIIKSSAQTNRWVKRHEIKPGVNHYLIKAPLENRAALLDFEDRNDVFNWGSADAFGGVFVGFSGVTFAANDSAPVVTVCSRVSLQIMLEYANLGLATRGVVQRVDRIEKELEQMGVDVKVDAYQQLENVYDDI